MNHIPLQRHAIIGTEVEYMTDAISDRDLTGAGKYTKRCEEWFLEQESLSKCRVFLTTSGTASLEMAAILADFQPGDEVILPSFTFVSTVNAFVLRGATPVFVDIEAGTMNIDAKQIRAAITGRTKAIVPVHYAAVACDMDAIMALANEFNLLVIEDAAQAPTASYRGQALGGIGHIGCISFHGTKNFTAGGQGGAVLVRDPVLFARAEIIYDNGTNRRECLRGEVDHYAWRDIGSNFILSEISAAFLWAHLEAYKPINERRHFLWNRYMELFQPLQLKGVIALPHVPKEAKHNAHIFYIRLLEPQRRKELMTQLSAQKITASSHFTPLHDSPHGRKVGRFVGQDVNSTACSLQILRLPLYYGLSDEDQNRIVAVVNSFFKSVNGEVNGELRTE